MIPASPRRKVALITGANGGIGREVARQLSEREIAVVLGCRNLRAGEEAAGELTRAGASAVAVRLDVTEPGCHDSAVATIRDRFGRLDILVNNAGELREVHALEVTADDLMAIFATNVAGVGEMIRAALPLLRSSESPRIVNVTSTTASLALTAQGKDFGGDASVRLVYSVSKAALNMLTLQYHVSFQVDPSLRHIKINAATPGYTATAINGFRGTRTVEDGARIITTLATAPDDGPSGCFLNDEGPVPW